MAVTWLTTNELCEALRISRRTLERNRTLFSCGVHYRLKNPNSAKNPHKLWRLDRVEESLMNPHVLRRKRSG
ncbi:MAG: hypothetical protein RLZZ515_437 [Cyanobacteriota bacterium]|jgi:hypothetical protein